MRVLARLALATTIVLALMAPVRAASVSTTQSELPSVISAREGYAFGAFSNVVAVSTVSTAIACITNPNTSGSVVIFDSIEISATGPYSVAVWRGGITIGGGSSAIVGNLYGLTAPNYASQTTVLTGASTAITYSGGTQIAGTYNSANAIYNPIPTSGMVALQPGQNACYIGQGLGVGTISMSASLKWFERPLGAISAP